MKSYSPQYFVQFLCSDRLWQFWSLNLFGWAGYSLFSVLGAIIWQRFGRTALFRVSGCAHGFLLSLLMRVLFHRFWGAAPQKRTADPFGCGQRQCDLVSVQIGVLL